MHFYDCYIESHEDINPDPEMVLDMFEESNIENAIYQDGILQPFIIKLQERIKTLTMFLVGPSSLMLARKRHGGVQKTRQFAKKWKDRESMWVAFANDA